MKNIKRLIALAAAMMMLVSVFCVVNVNAAVSGGKGKLWVSHFNQEDTYANAAVIFTKEFMGDKTLAQICADYKGKVSEKLNEVDPDWAATAANHAFNEYYGLACAWNEENGRYEVTAVAKRKGCSSLPCPENGFLFVMHHDDDYSGDHNYPSNEFADLNYGEKLSGAILPDWLPLENQPVYLYNIDLSKTEPGSGIKTSGKFASKWSLEGLDNGLKEVYSNFKSESYIYVGEEDPDATVAAYEPANITVSFSRIDKLSAEVSKLDQLDYNATSWQNLQDVLNKYDDAAKAEMKNKDVAAWAKEIEDAISALIVAGEEDVSGESGSSSDNDNTGFMGSEDEKSDSGSFTLLGLAGVGAILVLVGIILIGLLVVAGIVFIIVAATKGKGKKTEEVKAEEPAAEEPAAEEKAEEKTEEKTEE